MCHRIWIFNTRFANILYIYIYIWKSILFVRPARACQHTFLQLYSSETIVAKRDPRDAFMLEEKANSVKCLILTLFATYFLICTVFFENILFLEKDKSMNFYLLLKKKFVSFFLCKFFSPKINYYIIIQYSAVVWTFCPCFFSSLFLQQRR